LRQYLLLAFLEDIPRNISIRAIEDTHLLALGKQAFVNIVKEYPEIVLPICKVMCYRIRMLAEEVKKCEEMVSDRQS
jgi:CRP-like cAMP-binding protein